MSKRELIKAEIDAIPDDRLEELHRFLGEFRKWRPNSDQPGFLDALQQIEIEGPPDFAENWNLYASGGKSLDADVR